MSANVKFLDTVGTTRPACSTNRDMLFVRAVNGTCGVHVLQDIRPCREGPPVGPRLIKRGDLVKAKYDGSLPITKPACNGCC